jgi:hypothetical protein
VTVDMNNKQRHGKYTKVIHPVLSVTIPALPPINWVPAIVFNRGVDEYGNGFTREYDVEVNDKLFDELLPQYLYEAVTPLLRAQLADVILSNTRLPGPPTLGAESISDYFEVTTNLSRRGHMELGLEMTRANYPYKAVSDAPAPEFCIHLCDGRY